MNFNQKEQNQAYVGSLDMTTSVVSQYLKKFHKKLPEIIGLRKLEGQIKQGEYMLNWFKGFSYSRTINLFI